MSKKPFASVIVVAAAALMTPGDAGAQVPSTRPAVDAPARLARPFRWVTTPALIAGKGDASHAINAIKDPTVVRYEGRWHVFASGVTKAGSYGVVYLSFADWNDAAAAPQTCLDALPNLAGYHCAPQVFYFAPQKLWYLITTSQHPTYSTSPDVARPESWTKPKPFFAGTPKSVVEGWLDYWVICDETHAYMFFTDDHGRFFRTRTPLADFPNGFDEPVVAMQEKVPRELFEGSCTYRIKGTSQYLTLVEAANDHWTRYYKAFVADRLDGDWRPLAAEWGDAFADVTRVRAKDGGAVWTKDISHGELLRDGFDQTLTVDPARLELLYQGIDTRDPSTKDYNAIRWQLGLLRRDE